jgi:hypothetical protein
MPGSSPEERACKYSEGFGGGIAYAEFTKVVVQVSCGVRCSSGAEDRNEWRIAGREKFSIIN